MSVTIAPQAQIFEIIKGLRPCDDAMRQDTSANQDHVISDATTVTLVHLQAIYDQQVPNANEVHEMKMEISRAELAEQKAFWDRRQGLMQIESNAKLAALEEVKDADLRSIELLLERRLEQRQERHQTDLDRLIEYFDLRARSIEELHELNKQQRCVQPADVPHKEPGGYEGNEIGDVGGLGMRRYSDDEDESGMVARCNKRTRMDV